MPCFESYGACFRRPNSEMRWLGRVDRRAYIKECELTSGASTVRGQGYCAVLSKSREIYCKLLSCSIVGLLFIVCRVSIERLPALHIFYQAVLRCCRLLYYHCLQSLPALMRQQSHHHPMPWQSAIHTCTPGCQVHLPPTLRETKHNSGMATS